MAHTRVTGRGGPRLLNGGVSDFLRFAHECRLHGYTEARPQGQRTTPRWHFNEDGSQLTGRSALPLNSM